jgi:uncharacterized glyoxalase superfamily protein PhnB
MHFRLNPYLSFDGTARAAMEFYRDVLGGEFAVNTYGEFGDPSAPGADRIMHARLDTTAGFTLMAGDTPTGMAHAAVQGISVSLSGDNADELREPVLGQRGSPVGCLVTDPWSSVSLKIDDVAGQFVARSRPGT